MKLFIYEAEAFEREEFNLIDTIEGADNNDCEAKASSQYGDSDLYKWSYTEA